MTGRRVPQLVYLYGPPAVGKLTVAEKLVDPARLREMLAVHDRSPRGADDLVVDTSALSPDDAAQAIATWLGGETTRASRSGTGDEG